MTGRTEPALHPSSFSTQSEAQHPIRRLLPFILLLTPSFQEILEIQVALKLMLLDVLTNQTNSRIEEKNPPSFETLKNTQTW